MGQELARKGNYAEMRVAADCIRRGYSVSIPFGHETRYDLIIDKNGTLIRTQVKHAQLEGDSVRVKCTSTNHGGASAPYTLTCVDMIAAFEPTTDRVYYLPMSEIGGITRAALLRLIPAKNNQTKGIRLASDFLDP
jgi:hypothetical protein